MKKCSTCKIVKELTLFTKRKREKDGYYTICKECKKISDSKYIKKYKLRKNDVYKRYNLTLIQYENMVLKQKNLCLICKIQPKRKLYVDHCHKTGKVRGLLCCSCNSAIGLLKENINTLLNAISYLQMETR